jgi:hypothetical protein
MLIPNGRRVMELALVLCAIGTITACAPHSQLSETQRVSYPLVINNRSDFEVVVYAMASGTTRGQRLGTARPFSTTRLSIPSHALQTMDLFAVQLHAIGAPRSVPNWVSTGTVLTDGLMAKLDIMGDMSGNLRFSSLSAHIARPSP